MVEFVKFKFDRQKQKSYRPTKIKLLIPISNKIRFVNLKFNGLIILENFKNRLLHFIYIR